MCEVPNSMNSVEDPQSPPEVGSLLNDGDMCKCGCGGKAAYIVKSEDYEGQPFEEPCCINSRDYLRECASIFDKPYEEKPCT